jgi:hypothetical protein
VSGTPYTKDVLALADHLFDLFPTLSGLEILAIASETVEFYNNREEKFDLPAYTERVAEGMVKMNKLHADLYTDRDPQNGAPA